MAGRVHDLITAENFAKWAEERECVADCRGAVLYSCVLARWLQSLGFADACMGMFYFGVDGLLNRPAPEWMRRVAQHYDYGQRSGPALAKIARSAA